MECETHKKTHKTSSVDRKFSSCRIYIFGGEGGGASKKQVAATTAALVADRVAARGFIIIIIIIVEWIFDRYIQEDVYK